MVADRRPVARIAIVVRADWPKLAFIMAQRVAMPIAMTQVIGQGVGHLETRAAACGRLGLC